MASSMLFLNSILECLSNESWKLLKVTLNFLATGLYIRTFSSSSFINLKLFSKINLIAGSKLVENDFQ